MNIISINGIGDSNIDLRVWESELYHDDIIFSLHDYFINNNILDDRAIGVSILNEYNKR